jgi:rubrerythrin
MAGVLSRIMLAAARLEVFAKKAKAQGKAAEAALFGAMAAAQQVHIRRLTMLLRGKVGDTEANLAEVTGHMLPGLISRLVPQVEEADAAGLEIVGTALDQAVQVDVRSGEMARRLSEGEQTAAYWLCPICGWLELEGPPERCPVCGALGSKFQEVG